MSVTIMEAGLHHRNVFILVYKLLTHPMHPSGTGLVPYTLRVGMRQVEKAVTIMVRKFKAETTKGGDRISVLGFHCTMEICLSTI